MAGIIPTRTLAKLYEEQQFYFEAYIIYRILYTSNPSEYIKKKISTTGANLFENIMLKENTKKIFDKEEIIEIGILPKKEYNLYQKISAELEDSPPKKEFLQEPKEIKISDELKDISGEELFDIIRNNFPDKKPEDIKLAEIYEIIKKK